MKYQYKNIGIKDIFFLLERNRKTYKRKHDHYDTNWWFHTKTIPQDFNTLFKQNIQFKKKQKKKKL